MLSILKFLLKYILYVLSKIFYRKKRIWVFKGFADKYIDNSKSLFEYVNKYKKSIKAIWITSDFDTCNKVKSLKYECYMKNSIKGIYYLLNSKFYFYGDYVDYSTSNGAITINLWHGLPMKKIEFDIKSGSLKALFNNSVKSRIKYPHLYHKPNYVISSSNSMSEKIFMSAFRVPIENCLNFGFPRNDVLFNESNYLLGYFKMNDKDIYNLFNEKYNKIFIYLPTWRDNGEDFFGNSGINLIELNNLMKRENSLFIIKMHPATKLNIDVNQFSNLELLNNNVDLYAILPLTDVLITDYSSVFFDYLLLNKKIIFFPFDYKDYIKGREFYFNYKDIITENPVYTFEELERKLFENFEMNNVYKKTKYLSWDYEDNNASERIADYFIDYQREKK